MLRTSSLLLTAVLAAAPALAQEADGYNHNSGNNF